MKDEAFGCQRHLDALGFPAVRQELMDLEKKWNDLEPWQRGEVLIDLILCGCSKKGLASLLPCSARTIGTYMDMADLRLFLREGRGAFSPERFFRNWDRLQQARRRTRERNNRLAANAQLEFSFPEVPVEGYPLSNV